MFDIKDRIITDLSEVINKPDFLLKMDWTKINEKLKIEKEKSLKWLKNALENKKEKSDYRDDIINYLIEKNNKNDGIINYFIEENKERDNRINDLYNENLQLNNQINNLYFNNSKLHNYINEKSN